MRVRTLRFICALTCVSTRALTRVVKDRVPACSIPSIHFHTLAGVLLNVPVKFFIIYREREARSQGRKVTVTDW